MGSERRQAWRTGLVLDVWYEGENVRGETRISDLSVRGAYIETMTPLPVGSTFKLVFALPDSMVIETEGTVVRREPHGGMGVRFLSLTPEQANYIRQFIHA
jgi:c-di-GMP-binding flagellar brake protein YcgR